jgi:hypothetical protein
MENIDFDPIQSRIDRWSHHQIQLTRLSVAERLDYLDALEKEMETDWEFQDDPVGLLRRQWLL